MTFQSCKKKVNETKNVLSDLQNIMKQKTDSEDIHKNRSKIDLD